MNKKEILLPLAIHIVITVITLWIFSIIENFDGLMINDILRNTVYVFEGLLTIFLYGHTFRKYRRFLTMEGIKSWSVILLSINLILMTIGHVISCYGVSITAANGTVPVIALEMLNYGFMPVIHLVNGVIKIKNLDTFIIAVISPGVFYGLGKLRMSKKK